MNIKYNSVEEMVMDLQGYKGKSKKWARRRGKLAYNLLLELNPLGFFAYYENATYSGSRGEVRQEDSL